MSASAHFSFQVPAPYRAILRSFSITPTKFFEPPEADFISSSLTIGEKAFWSPLGAFNWTVTGTFVPNYTNLLLGQAYENIPCFVLVDSNQWINLLLSFSATYQTLTGGASANLAGFNILVTFYGQLLLSTGRALNFEVSSDLKSKPVYIENAPEKYVSLRKTPLLKTPLRKGLSTK